MSLLLAALCVGVACATHTAYVPERLRSVPAMPPAGWAESQIARFKKLTFSDEFDDIDPTVWQHEITMSGGGNWEFEYYTNNRTNSYVRNGTLFLRPTLSADTFGEANIESGFTVDLWGGDPANLCTSNFEYGCLRSSAGGNIINPIQSARIRSTAGLNMQYGHVEVVAKLPKGDWIWPAIWMLPTYNQYGDWPSSGEIDIMESRGNDASYPAGGNNIFSSTLHWGPSWNMDPYLKTHATYTLPSGSLSDSFHTYGLVWTEDALMTYIDQPSNVVLYVPFNESFWHKGGFDQTGMNNPWANRNTSAPFDRKFFLIFNVAVGGTNSYFPDGVGGKPWSNTSPHASADFWHGKGQWLPTWQGEDVAMQISSVKVFQD